jgi:xanthine dehydrogenase iron-sulfur cluster and FAD-binding subunit A
MVTNAMFAYGGMGRQTLRATSAENFILGRHWGEEHMLDSLLMQLNEVRI